MVEVGSGPDHPQVVHLPRVGVEVVEFLEVGLAEIDVERAALDSSLELSIELVAVRGPEWVGPVNRTQHRMKITHPHATKNGHCKERITRRVGRPRNAWNMIVVMSKLPTLSSTGAR